MTESIQQAAVLGTTSWGTTLAILLARNGVNVSLLARSDQETARLQEDRSHLSLPGIAFPDRLKVMTAATSVLDVPLLCVAVPSATMIENLHSIQSIISPSTLILSATKGFSSGQPRRMSELVNEILPDNEVAVLTGPNLSIELSKGLPGATVIATKSTQSELLLGAFHSESFRVYLEDDLVGAEFGGAMKNVIAIAAGIADSLRVGDNAKAALLVRGLAEMTRLGQAFGANPLTFQGLAGAGDLIATAYSPLSRNRLFGEKIGNGLDTASALAEIGQTVEGLHSLTAALALAEVASVELPICEELDSIISRRKSARDALTSLISREANTAPVVDSIVE